MENSNAQEDWY